MNISVWSVLNVFVVFPSHKPFLIELNITMNYNIRVCG